MLKMKYYENRNTKGNSYQKMKRSPDERPKKQKTKRAHET
jgi:hypothetical protein